MGNQQPLRALYHGRTGCCARTAWAGIGLGQTRVLCYQYGGESDKGLEPAGSPANCLHRVPASNALPF